MHSFSKFALCTWLVTMTVASGTMAAVTNDCNRTNADTQTNNSGKNTVRQIGLRGSPPHPAHPPGGMHPVIPESGRHPGADCPAQQTAAPNATPPVNGPSSQPSELKNLPANPTPAQIKSIDAMVDRQIDASE